MRRPDELAQVRQLGVPVPRRNSIAPPSRRRRRSNHRHGRARRRRRSNRCCQLHIRRANGPMAMEGAGQRSGLGATSAEEHAIAIADNAMTGFPIYMI